MVTAHVLSADRLSNMSNEDVGTDPVIRVETDLPLGQNNAFYMSEVDFDGRPVILPLANQPADAPIDYAAMNPGDLILFDEPDGIFHKRVSWAGRGFRQRGDSFDWGATSSTGQSY